MTSPRAVLISDVHYGLATLEVADAALRQAVAKANELGVPLIIAGDLHDTKANMRAECVNALKDTLSWVAAGIFILRGNHDSINEKSNISALRFLARDSDDEGFNRCIIVENATFITKFGFNGMSPWLIPYQHNPQEFQRITAKIDKGSLIICHQGINGSNSGEYIQDKSALTHDDVKDFRVISGHYHTRQSIKTGPNGAWDYIGNPYTLNFAEANDPDKGFQILMNDGTLEFIPTNLRAHVVIDTHISDIAFTGGMPEPDDIVLVKLRGTPAELAKANKDFVRHYVPRLPSNFRLDLIPDDQESTAPEQVNLPQPELLDKIIDSITNATDDQKQRLKTLWKEL